MLQRAQPYSGYVQPLTAPEDKMLTHSDRGAPLGELMRRYWQPVAIASRLGERPMIVKLLGEELVLFRDRGARLGLLHKHCAHRGASLEFGRVEAQGLRCCYHGWLYDVDGMLLEAPGEPAETTLKRVVCQGAYPVEEMGGLIFAYLGPAEARPPLPKFDTMDGRAELVPYSLHYPCNWLQVHENQMDPMHAVFLHSRMGENHFTAAWGEMPVVEYGQRVDRVYYVATRRVGENAWIRLNEVMTPNMGQVAALWETGTETRDFQRVGITRWTVPIDNSSCWIFGVRHYNEEVEPPGMGLGDKTAVGHDKFDIYGQTSARSYDEMQRNPGDWEAQVSQGPIAIHSLEHRGVTDTGVNVLRQQLRAAIEGRLDASQSHGIASGEASIPTWTCNAIFRWDWREEPGSDEERETLRKLGRGVRDAVFAADDLPATERAAAVKKAIAVLSRG
jgi:nitrite reductase/ring-hydroxylating ferredoxin subunit